MTQHCLEAPGLKNKNVVNPFKANKYSAKRWLAPRRHRRSQRLHMGLLDMVESVTGASGDGTNAKVAGGLLQALDEHPGGLSGVMESFRNNGMQEHVQNWASGQQSQATPEQIQTGLGGTGLIERVASKAGVSPQVAQMALATVLPMVISHFTAGGQQAPPQNGFGGMASQILGRFI